MCILIKEALCISEEANNEELETEIASFHQHYVVCFYLKSIQGKHLHIHQPKLPIITN